MSHGEHPLGAAGVMTVSQSPFNMKLQLVANAGSSRCALWPNSSGVYPTQSAGFQLTMSGSLTKGCGVPPFYQLEVEHSVVAATPSLPLLQFVPPGVSLSFASIERVVVSANVSSQNETQRSLSIRSPSWRMEGSSSAGTVVETVHFPAEMSPDVDMYHPPAVENQTSQDLTAVPSSAAMATESWSPTSMFPAARVVPFGVLMPQLCGIAQFRLERLRY